MHIKQIESSPQMLASLNPEPKHPSHTTTQHKKIDAHNGYRKSQDSQNNHHHRQTGRQSRAMQSGMGKMGKLKYDRLQLQENTVDTIRQSGMNQEVFDYSQSCSQAENTKDNSRSFLQFSCLTQLQNQRNHSSRFTHAQQLYHQGKYQQSLMHLNLYLQNIQQDSFMSSKNSKHQLAHAYYYLGLIQLKLNNKQSAQCWLTKCMQTDAHFYKSYHEMIRLYMSDKNYEKAQVVYRKLRSINPTDIENYMQYANTLRINKLMHKAKQVYLNAIECIPTSSAELYYKLALLCHYQLKQPYQALQNYKKSLSLDPKNAKIHLHLGILCSQLDMYEQAKFHYLKSIKYNSNNQYPYFNLGILYAHKKLYAKAEKVYKKIIQDINPEFEDAYYNLGSLYFKLNRTQQAQFYYRSLLNCNPKYANAILNLAIILHHNQKLQQAQQLYRQYIELCPKNQQAYICLADLLLKFKQKQNQAQKYYLAAVQINKSSASACLHLGAFYFAKKQYNKSRQYYDRAINLDQSYGKAYYNIGVLQNKRKNYGEALEMFWKAQQLQPNNPLFLIALSKILFFLKMPDTFQKLNKAKQVIYNLSDQKLLQYYDLNKNNIIWIKSTLEEIEILESLQQKKLNMNEQQLSNLSSINNSFFESFQQDFLKMKGENKQIRDIKKRLQILENQMIYVKKNLEQIKKQLQWDQKFQNLLQKNEQLAPYFRNLFTILSTSIYAYRSVHLGITQPGFNIIKSKAGSFIQKITKILSIGKSVPIISSFCSILVKIGELYCQQQSQHVIKLIVSTTERFYNQKKVTRATNQAILYMSSNQEFMNQLQNKRNEDQNIWYKKLIKKAQKIQHDIFSKITSFGGHQISDQMNMAMSDTAQIIITMIKKQNRQLIQQSSNPILKAIQIWISQRIKQKRLLTEIPKNTIESKSKSNSNQVKLKLLIFKANLTKNTRMFGKMDPYCRVTYRGNIWQTDVHVNGHQNPVWTCPQFEIRKINCEQKKLFAEIDQKIKFEVFDKNTSSNKDKLIGEAKLQFDQQTLLNINQISLIKKQKKVGQIKVKFF